MTAMVSIFPHIRATTGGQPTALPDVLAAIQSGRWQREVEAVRAEAAGSQAYDQAKRALPYFTPSGTFERRAIGGLVEHSGFMSIDLDAKQNPAANWPLVRVSIEHDPYTYACFASTGGQGLCVLVPVPTTHHALSFCALERYYLQSFGLTVDTACKDVSRARFVSYDPALYLNPDANTFDEILEEPAQKVPPRAAPTDAEPDLRNADTETQLIAIGVKMIREAADGGKHKAVRDAAYLLGGYVGSGYVTEAAAYDALLAAVLAKENVASLKNAEDAIRSGLAKGAARPLLPDWLQLKIRKELRAAQGNPGVVVTIGHREAVAAHLDPKGVTAAVQAIADEQAEAHARSLLTFWYLADATKRDGPKRLQLSLDKFTTWLAAEGFRKLGSGGSYATVRVVDNVVHETDRGQLMDFVLGYLDGLPYEFDGEVYRFQVRELVLAQERKLFDDKFLQALPGLGDNWLRDTAETAHYFFENCWVRVTAAGITTHYYEQLPGLIWAEQRRPHGFALLHNQQQPCLFDRFTANVCNGNAERLALLRASLGYLLHGFKEESNAKCVIFVDEVATTGKPDGRTGKSMLIKAVSELVKVTLIPGATFRFEDGFRFQRLTASTRIAYFDEWDGRRLPFKKLFTEITAELAVNRKNHAEFTIPFADSPKFAITTNDVVSGEGGSHEGRKIEIPLAPHYSSTFTPRMEFGQGFFHEGWDAAEWNRFFNLALTWVRDFLAGGRQLVQLQSAALDARKLEDATSPEFLEFARALAERGEANPLDSTLWADDLYQQFLNYSGEAQHRFPPRRFYQWMAKVGFARKTWQARDMNRGKSYFEAPQPEAG